MPTRSIRTLVALLSLTAIIMVARSRSVIRVTPGVSPPMIELSGTRSEACTVYRSVSFSLPTCA